MIHTFAAPVRPHVEDVVRRARWNLLVVFPYISTVRANWLLGLLSQEGAAVAVTALTSIAPQSVASGALEIEALELLAATRARSEIVNLPRLHAKVYVADCDLAIVSSANLTQGGMEGNYEYGVAIDTPRAVAQIRKDMEDYARLGNRLSSDDIRRLTDLGRELRSAYETVAKTVEGPASRKFQLLLRQMRLPILEAQVGVRSANSIFADVIRYVLKEGPLTTEELHPKIQRLIPDLCDDREELVIHGQRFGKRWKHAVRNAQQYLKARGIIQGRGRLWQLTGHQMRRRA